MSTKKKGHSIHRAGPQARPGINELLTVQKAGDEGQEGLGQSSHNGDRQRRRGSLRGRKEGVRGRKNATNILVVVGIMEEGQGPLLAPGHRYRMGRFKVMGWGHEG